MDDGWFKALRRIPFRWRNGRRSPALPLGVSLGWLVALAIAFPVAVSVAQESGDDDDPLAASTLTVNVELILDASGSMAETIPGTENQSRMDAAKLALLEVIAQIPERDGLNVGLRVYGHQGSNSEADRRASCQATELLVPIASVDKAALVRQVETMAPTGWTPLALSLEAAAADFAPGGESVTNAIIMVTDGEETCDGDPCALAGALHAAEIGLTTHVVGFALTPTQREAVRCIAEEGGGELFAADDAASLTEAVFTAFTQIETTPTPEPVEVETDMEVGGYVAGNAFGFLDEGTPGELSVVAFGSYEDGELALVIRNNRGEAVENVQVEIVGRAGGELVVTGGAQGIQPFVVEDGAVTIGYGYFSGAEFPEDTEFEFDVSADPAGTVEITGKRDLIVEEVNGDEDAIIGILRNDHDDDIEGFLITAGVCFDEAGQPTEYVQDIAGGGTFAAGDSVPFSISTALSEAPCSHFLVTGYGSAP
ncbi:MAG: VWA domain-containing protein [Chloroflexota bacterium]|nr:VWA domain-containing protein [Chloroflexota bacterium]